MNRKIIALIVLGTVLLACLLACGYFGAKAVRNTRLRRAAIAAYEKKDYRQAERLLLQYVRKDPNAEAEFVALANIYRESGNAGKEAQMWQTAASLNPLKPEYRENMLTSAVKAADYSLLHSILGRKARLGGDFTDQELYLYVISSYRIGYKKDGDDAYRKAVEADPEAFHKNELGKMAEFMADYSNLSEAERKNYLNTAIRSEDPVVRFEALYIAIRRTNLDEEAAEMEELLKQAVETNYFAGTPLLAEFYASKYRFAEILDILAPYLKSFDDITLYLLYAESCVFEGKLNELKAMEKKLRRKSGPLQLMADYCEILIAYLENDMDRLVASVRKSGKLVNTPLSRLVHLRVALVNDSFNEILTVAKEIFSNPPFRDLHNRALLICMDYLSEEMKKPENQKDPSQMAELAKVLSGYLQGNRLLTEIILMDRYKKGLVKEVELTEALELFPDDALLQRVAAEHMIFNGQSGRALPIVEQIMEAAKEAGQEPDREARFLYMLALDQLRHRDEAGEVFRKLLEQSEFDMELLTMYFQYCVENKRMEDLMAMAERLDAAKDGSLKRYGEVFRAAALLLTGEEEKEKKALDMLASTPDDNPDFAFYAANRLCDNDRLDEAEAKYKAILKTYRDPSLVYVNLSLVYLAKDDVEKAMEAAKEAFGMKKDSMLPAFIYAKMLSADERYEEALSILNFPRRAVNYREDIVNLWVECMHHVIENSIAGERYMQAEEQCLHLLTIAPDDEFGKANLEKVRNLMKQEENEAQDRNATPAA